MSAKRGLGKGFESIIPTDLLDESFDPAVTGDGQVSELRQIKINQITPDPTQPRRQFDEAAIKELAASISEHGILQPIVVAPKGEGYQIIAGERRFRAAKVAKLDRIPALVRTVNDQHRLEMSLIENLQRSDLNAYETAMAYARLRDQFGMSLAEIGHRVGDKNVSTISNTMRLLKLPKQVLVLLAEGKLTEGQARPLIGLDESAIEKVLPRILKGEWSVHRIEEYVASLRDRDQDTEDATSETKQYYEAAEKHLIKRYGRQVTVKVNPRGNGRIVLRFDNLSDFERLNKLLG